MLMTSKQFFVGLLYVHFCLSRSEKKTINSVILTKSCKELKTNEGDLECYTYTLT